MQKPSCTQGPDIAVTDNNNIILLIIEQDGMSHNLAKSKSRDEARNQHYKDADIPFIVLATKELKESGTAWHYCLDKEIKNKTGFIKNNPKRAFELYGF